MDWIRSFLEPKSGDKEAQEEEKSPPNLVNGVFPLPGVTHGTNSTASTPTRPWNGPSGAGTTPYRLDASRQLHPGGRTVAAAMTTTTMPASDDRGYGGGTYDYYPSQQPWSATSRNAAAPAAPSFAPKPPPPSAKSPPAPRGPFDPTQDGPAQWHGASEATGASRWLGGGDAPFIPPRSYDRSPAGRGAATSTTMGTPQPETPTADPYRRSFGDSNLQGPHHSAGPNVRPSQYRYNPRTSVASTAPLMVPKSAPRETLEARQMVRSRRLVAASAHWQQQQQRSPSVLWRAQEMVASADKAAAKRWNATSRIVSKRCRLELEGDVLPVEGASAAERPKALVGEPGDSVGQDRPSKRQRQEASDDEKKPAAARPRAVAASQPTVPANPPPPCRRRRRWGTDVTVEIKESVRTESVPNPVRSNGGVEELRKHPPARAGRLGQGYTNQPIPSNAVRSRKTGGRASASKRSSVSSPYAQSAASDVPPSPSELDKKAKKSDTGETIRSRDDPNYPITGNWGNLFQNLKKFSWKCAICEVGQEDPNSVKCVACEAPRYAWTCQSCGFGNEDVKLTECKQCGASRQDATSSSLVPQASSTGAAAAPAASSIVFGAKAVSSTTAPTTSAASSAATPKFTFGVQSATTTTTSAPTASQPSFQFTAPSTTSTGAGAAVQARSISPEPAASTVNGSKVSGFQFGSSTSNADSTAHESKTTSSTAPGFGFTFAGQMNGSKTDAGKAKEDAILSHSSEATAPAPPSIPPSSSSLGFGQASNVRFSESAGSPDGPKKRHALPKDIEDRKAEQSKSDASAGVFVFGASATAAPSTLAPPEAAPSTLRAAPFGFPSTTSATAMPNNSFQPNMSRPPDNSTTPVAPAPFSFGATSAGETASAPSFGSTVTSAALGALGSRKRSNGTSGIGPANESGNAREANPVLPFRSTPAPAPAPVSNSTENLTAVSSFGSSSSELQAGIGQGATFGAAAFGQSTGFGMSTSAAPAPPASGTITTFGSATTTILPPVSGQPFMFGSSSSSTTSTSNQPMFGTNRAPASSGPQFGSAPSAPHFGSSTTPAPAPAVQQFGSTPSGPPFGASPAFGSANAAQPATQVGFGLQAQQPIGPAGFQQFGSLSASSSQSSITGFAGSTSFGLGGSGNVPVPAPAYGGFGGTSIAAPAPSQSSFGQPVQPTSSFSARSTAPVGGFGSSGAGAASGVTFEMGAPPKASNTHGRRIVKARRPVPGGGRGA